MIELGDELVDALRDVLPLLVRVEELSLERPYAAVLLLEPTSQGSGLALLPLVGLHQLVDGALEPLEVVRVSLDGGNVRPPYAKIVPAAPRARQPASDRFSAPTPRGGTYT